MQVVGELRVVTDELALRETPSEPMMIEQTPTLLRAIRTAPSSVSPVAKAISSNAVSFVRAEMGASEGFSTVFSSM